MTASAVPFPAGRPRRREAVDGRVPILQRPLTSYHLLLWSAGALLTLGMVMVFSASSVNSYASSGSSFTTFSKQVLWFFIGFPAAVVATRMPVRFWRALAYPLLIVSILGLMAVLVPGVGVEVSGARRWIDLGPFQLQPSEPAKLALALWGADLLVRKQKLLTQWRHLAVPLLPVTVLLVALVMEEPDMGTTGSVLLVALGLLFVVGAPLRIFGAVLAVTAVGAGFMAVAEPYRFRRLTAFTDPCSAAQIKGDGFQACNGITGLASGGWWGTGLGASKQKWFWLPNAHTDYIFAVIGEELGLVGTLLVVVLFAALGYAGLRIATRTVDPFSKLAAAAVTTWLVGQAVVNIGYVAGMLPVTGVPLPLISFGGTSLVLTMVAVGMLASFARNEPGVAEVLAARERRGLLGRFRRERPAVAPSRAVAARSIRRSSQASRTPARSSARSSAGSPARPSARSSAPARARVPARPARRG